MRKTTMLAMLMLCVAASSALGRYAWCWTLPYNIVPDNDSTSEEYYLTGDNGSHAVAMTKYYSGGWKLWTSILAVRRKYPWNPDTHYVGRIQAYEYRDIGADWHRWDRYNLEWPFVPSEPRENETLAVNCHVANNALYKTYTWGNLNTVDPELPAGYGIDPGSDDQNLGYQEDDWWDSPHDFSDDLNDSMAKDMGVAVALFKGPNDAARARGVAAWVSRHMGYIELRRVTTSDGGATWVNGVGGQHFIVRIDTVKSDTWWRRPSIATDDSNGSNAYLAYESTATNGLSGHIMFRKSTDWGDDWNEDVTWLGYGRLLAVSCG